TQVALSAAQLANTAATSVGAESAATSAAVSGALGAVGLFAAPVIMGLTTPAYSLKPSYYTNMSNILSKGPSDPGYWGAVAEAQASGDPAELALLRQYGIATSPWGANGQPSSSTL